VEDLGIVQSLDDARLTERLTRLASSERASIATLVETLAEFDRRRLFLPAGFTSLFAYCTDRLHLSQDEAFYRIEAARVSVRFPIVIGMLGRRELTLTAVRLLGPHLTDENYMRVLRAAVHKKREAIEMLAASLRPSPPVPSVVRKLPDLIRTPAELPVAAQPARLPADGGRSSPPSRRTALAPLSESHYRLQITISAATREKLREIQAMMRHAVPDGNPAVIVDRSFDLLLSNLKRKKTAATAKPRPGGREPRGRHIPARVRRTVWERDGGRCAFVSADGTRCDADGFVEYHHVEPYARGGKATAANIQLRCRTHNQYEAEVAGLKRRA